MNLLAPRNDRQKGGGFVGIVKTSLDAGFWNRMPARETAQFEGLILNGADTECDGRNAASVADTISVDS